MVLGGTQGERPSAPADGALSLLGLQRSNKSIARLCSFSMTTEKLLHSAAVIAGRSGNDMLPLGDDERELSR